jgi:hypothetical protein
MIPPESLRQALFWLAVLAFVAGHAALLARSLRGRPAVAPAAVRIGSGRAAELAMLLLPAALTALLFALAWRRISAGSP